MNQKTLFAALSCVAALVTTRDTAFSQLSTGDFLFQKKAATGYTVVPLTPQANKLIGFDGSGVFGLQTAGGAISTLTDVTLTGLTSGDFLKYNGTAWINRTAANVRTDLGLVTTTGGNGATDSGKVPLLNADGGLSLGATTEATAGQILLINCSTGKCLQLGTYGAGAFGMDITTHGANSSAYVFHAGGTGAQVGCSFDFTTTVGGGTGFAADWSGAGHATNVGVDLTLDALGTALRVDGGVYSISATGVHNFLATTGNVTIGGGASASELRLLEPSGSGTNYTALKAQAQSANVTYTLPAADGTNGQVLSTNGSGTLSWATGGGGGTVIEIDTVAWVEADGNDSTGTVGDPAKPYLTMNEAYDDGARTFFLGSGTFAGLTKTGALDIKVFGLGAATTTVTLISSSNTGDVTVRDLGTQTLTVTTITSNGAAGAANSSGGAGGLIIVYNLVVGAINAFGGTGGDSDETSNAGSGGAGGAVVLWGPCNVTTINAAGGAGGAATDYPAGSGGQGGEAALNIGAEVATISAPGGAGGNSATSSGGDGGSGGNVNGRHARITSSIDLLGGGAGSGGMPSNGTDGGLSGEFVFCNSVTGSETIAAHGSYVAGTWYD